MDQAEQLRNMKSGLHGSTGKITGGASGTLKITAVTGGKGGVGKSSISLNMAIALSELGEKVCLLDADLGLSNIDIMLGLKVKYTVDHVFSGVKTLKEVSVRGPKNIILIPAASGLTHLADLQADVLEGFVAQAKQMGDEFDHLIIDTSAGISRQVMTFLKASSCVLVVLTPEPTSITDAYALIKSYKMEGGRSKIMLLMNMCRSEAEGLNVGARICQICMHFLGVETELAGVVTYDSCIPESVRRQKPFIENFPDSIPSGQIRKISAGMKRLKPSESDFGDFFNNMREFVS